MTKEVQTGQIVGQNILVRDPIYSTAYIVSSQQISAQKNGGSDYRTTY